MKFQSVAITAGSSPQEPGGHAPLKHSEDVMLPNTESQLRGGWHGCCVWHRPEGSRPAGLWELGDSRLGQTGCPSQPSTQTSCCSVTKSCLALCNAMDCSASGLPVLHPLPGFAQVHVHWIGDAIQPSHSLLLPYPPALNLSQHQGLFQWVASGEQRIGASASVLPMNIQGWFLLRWTGWISLESKGLSGVFSSATIPRVYMEEKKRDKMDPLWADC